MTEFIAKIETMIADQNEHTRIDVCCMYMYIMVNSETKLMRNVQQNI